MTIRIDRKRATGRGRSAASAVAVAALLAACAPAQELGGGIQNSFSNAFGGYINQNDVCVNERRAMVESASAFDQDTMKIVVASAAIGVVAGLISGDVGTGLAAGGIALAGGYLAKMIEDGRSGRQVTESVSSDIRTANSRIDRVLAAFRNVDSCRKREAETIKADLAAGRIARAEAENRMAGVRARRQEDVAKFRELADNISQSTVAYAAAYNEIAADNGGTELEIAENRTVTPTKRRAQKKTTEAGTLTDAGKENVDTLQRDCLTNVQKRDECFELAETAASEEEEFTL